MKFRLGLLARLKRHMPHKAAQIDPRFDQRLQRLGTREGLRAVQSGPFRIQRERPEA